MEQYMKGPPRDTFNSDGLYSDLSDLIDKIIKEQNQEDKKLRDAIDKIRQILEEVDE